MALGPATESAGAHSAALVVYTRCDAGCIRTAHSDSDDEGVGDGSGGGRSVAAPAAGEWLGDSAEPVRGTGARVPAGGTRAGRVARQRLRGLAEKGRFPARRSEDAAALGPHGFSGSSGRRVGAAPPVL